MYIERLKAIIEAIHDEKIKTKEYEFSEDYDIAQDNFQEFINQMTEDFNLILREGLKELNDREISLTQWKKDFKKFAKMIKIFHKVIDRL